jgi:hypothetical protein
MWPLPGLRDLPATRGLAARVEAGHEAQVRSEGARRFEALDAMELGDEDHRDRRVDAAEAPEPCDGLAIRGQLRRLGDRQRARSARTSSRHQQRSRIASCSGDGGATVVSTPARYSSAKLARIAAVGLDPFAGLTRDQRRGENFTHDAAARFETTLQRVPAGARLVADANLRPIGAPLEAPDELANRPLVVVDRELLVLSCGRRDGRAVEERAAPLDTVVAKNASRRDSRWAGRPAGS